MTAQKKRDQQPNSDLVKRNEHRVQSPLHSLVYSKVKDTNMAKSTPKKTETPATPANRGVDKLAAELRASVASLNEVLARAYDANLRTSIVAEAADAEHPKKMTLKVTSITVEV